MEVLESLGTESPLLWSFQRESPMEEKYFDLLNKGDDSSEYSQYFPAGYSPMHLACRHGHVEVFNLLHHSKCSNVHM